MNWNILKKCVLMLFLGAAVHLTWIIWKSFVLLTPSVWQWVNVPIVQLQLTLNSIFFILLLLMIWPCYAWQHKRWVKLTLPYLSVGLFVISLCRDGYLIGVLSPATMISYVSLVAVGLVLLPRVIVYSAFIPATLYLIGSAYLSYTGSLSYGPLFQISDHYYSNHFWLLSMLFFIAPILCTCLILFEVLLSQWRHREHLIKQLSQMDPLTNLFNRRSINQCLDQLNHPVHENYALVLLDLDHFKHINDQYGHHKGDEALVKVSAILSQLLRGTDVVGRFGGEEFILILHHSSLEQAQQIAERCRSAIEQIELFSDEGQRIQITASFGIAIAAAESRPQQLLSQADKALYQAKASGRNAVKIYFAASEPAV
jgi:diguanylate cyclase (GGDEF)-like protein